MQKLYTKGLSKVDGPSSLARNVRNAWVEVFVLRAMFSQGTETPSAVRIATSRQASTIWKANTNTERLALLRGADKEHLQLGWYADPNKNASCRQSYKWVIPQTVRNAIAITDKTWCITV